MIENSNELPIERENSFYKDTIGSLTQQSYLEYSKQLYLPLSKFFCLNTVSIVASQLSY